MLRVHHCLGLRTPLALPGCISRGGVAGGRHWTDVRGVRSLCQTLFQLWEGKRDSDREGSSVGDVNPGVHDFRRGPRTPGHAGWVGEPERSRVGGLSTHPGRQQGRAPEARKATDAAQGEGEGAGGASAQEPRFYSGFKQ